MESPSKLDELANTLYLQLKQNQQKFIRPSVFRKLYRLYSEWRSLAKQLRPMPGSRKEANRYALDVCLVHYLVERCFWCRYGDSDVVSGLLGILFEVDGHLGYLFDYRLLDVVSRVRAKDAICSAYQRKSTWKKEELMLEKIRPLDFFLHHAYKSQALFGEQRLAERAVARVTLRHRRRQDALYLPPCALWLAGDHLLLPRLLRYGLFAGARPDDGDVAKILTGVMAVLAMASGGGRDPLLNGWQCEAVRGVREAGNMLLRAVRAVDATCLLRCQKRRNRSGKVPKLIVDLSNSGWLPMLRCRCARVQPLQHLCRCAMRQSLCDAWQLPQGLTSLHLPQRIHRYLALECD